jgi:hypothetical protein
MRTTDQNGSAPATRTAPGTKAVRSTAFRAGAAGLDGGACVNVVRGIVDVLEEVGADEPVEWKSSGEVEVDEPG